MKELVYVDAHKLFCQYAFRGAHLDASYSKLTHKAIKYAQGVPLALKVLGRHLCGNSKEEWESAMRKLEVIPDVEIQEVLKISYDSLDDSQKNVFLDIAFFLEGERRDVVISFFDAIGFEAKIELSVFDGKSLITCLDNQIRMHDLLREMGREIVRKESIDHSGKRSRLWYHKNICEVLKKNKGTEAIKGISLDMGKANSEIQINPYTFSKMTELRFLKFYGSENKCMVSSLEGVPFTEVRYFEWHQYPLKTLDIHAENLVSLKMPGSKVKQLWDDVQNLVNLKKIDLWYSKLLTKLPDLSLAQNLEILDLGGCSSLTETHSSIQYLNKLEVLDLDRCESLRTLPTSIQSKYLKRLVLRGCSNLKNFPEISSSGIHRLDLTHVGIKELPSSIDRLSKLDTLKIHDCTSLESLPSSLSMFKSLTSLEIIYCPKLKRLPDELGNLKALEELRVEGTAIRRPPESLGQLSSLQILSLSDNSNLERAPESIRHLSKLTSLFISDCKMLQTLPELPCNLHDLDASGCTSLEALPASLSSKFYLSVDLSNCLKLDLSELSEIIKDRWMKQSYNYASCRGIYFPGDEILKLFRYQSMGSSVTLETPPPPPPPAPAGYNKLMGFAFCAVIAFSVPDHHHYWKGYLYCDLKVKSEGSYGHLHSRYLGEFSYLESDHVFLKIISYVEADSVFLRSYLSDSEDLVESFEEVYEVYFGIRCPHSQCLDCEVKKCGIDFVYAQDSRRPKRLKY